MEGGGGGGEDYILIVTLTLPQNNSCIRMGSDENVSLNATTTLSKRKESRSRIEPSRLSAYQPNALPLGQTGSPVHTSLCSIFGVTMVAILRPPLLRIWY